MLRRFVRQPDGQDLMEFALLGMAVSSMVCIAVLTTVPEYQNLGVLDREIRRGATRVTNTVRYVLSISLEDALRMARKPGPAEATDESQPRPAAPDQSK